MDQIGELIILLANQFQIEYEDKTSQYYLNWLDMLNEISIRKINNSLWCNDSTKSSNLFGLRLNRSGETRLVANI